MDSVITTVQTRGQITLPLKYREKLGIKPGSVVRVSFDGDKITTKPLKTSPLTVPAKYSPAESLKVLEEFTKSGKVYWTKQDDEHLAKLRKKDDKYLNW